MQIVAALAGAIIGALVAYVLDASVRAPQRRRDEIRALATALLAELEANLESYWKAFGRHIQEELQPGEPLVRLAIGNAGQNVTPVFDHNAGRLGLLDANDSARIVRAVALFKGHIETAAQRYAEITWFTNQTYESARANQMDVAKRFENFRTKAQIETGNALREQSRELTNAMRDAVETLKRILAASGPARGESALNLADGLAWATAILALCGVFLAAWSSVSVSSNFVGMMGTWGGISKVPTKLVLEQKAYSTGALIAFAAVAVAQVLSIASKDRKGPGGPIIIVSVVIVALVIGFTVSLGSYLDKVAGN
jgi:hypothetical protein